MTRRLDQEIFVCIDCETTGLSSTEDQVIEVAAITFSLNSHLETFESLIDPGCPIPQKSILIHHITDEMIKGKPRIKEVLPTLLEMIGDKIIVGHGIGFDIELLRIACERARIPNRLREAKFFDTLRLARLYGESPVNSLEQLRKHFNIQPEGAHRAMSDVIVNVEVFKYLVKNFRNIEQVVEVLSQPIKLKTMPLGKHKGRHFSEIPLEYLRWAANKDFDQDLLFSIRSEIKRRKKGNLFSQSSNPFQKLL